MSASRRSEYVEFLRQLQRISASAPRAKPPRLLNYHLLVRSPFPEAVAGIAERRQLMQHDLRRASAYYYASGGKALVGVARSIEGMDIDQEYVEDAGDDAVDEDDAIALEGSKDDASKTSPTDELKSSGGEGRQATESNADVDGSDGNSTVVVTSATQESSPKSATPYLSDIPLPRALYRHVMNPSINTANLSPLGKVTGFRIEVNGRRGTRANRQVVEYGKLATNSADKSLVDFAKASFYNKKGATGVKVWVAYAP